MAKYLIDVNLPYRFALWRGSDFLHLRDIDDQLPDHQVWQLARQENLTIVSKDSDFSTRALLETPPPRVIHIRFGNLKMRQFHARLSAIWPQVRDLSDKHRLVNVFEDWIEAIE